MCFSAQVEQAYRRLLREYGGDPGWDEIKKLFFQRAEDPKSVRIPKALELAFEHPKKKDEVEIKAFIDQYRSKQEQTLTQELFKQKKRLGDAERTLKTKITKKAQEDQRISSDKIEFLVARIADVKRTESKSGDDRIFPLWWSLIAAEESGKRKIIPARYHCRPAGKPEFFDRKFPGLYNARRDNLDKFWKDLFGSQHALMLVSSFYENVSVHSYEHRELRSGEEEQNVVLWFNPNPSIEMNIACLWSRWSADLVSFAAITDEPNEEVRAAGHDRTIINIGAEDIDAWLSPTGRETAEFYRMFDERKRPYFEHKKLAA